MAVVSTNYEIVNYALDNGQAVKFTPCLTVGAVAQSTEDSEPPLSAGDHLLSNGTIVTVASAGIVAKIEVDANAAARAKQVERRQRQGARYEKEMNRKNLASVFGQIRKSY